MCLNGMNEENIGRRDNIKKGQKAGMEGKES
jgi:hypothetical protein